jgi:hypothetical protein
MYETFIFTADFNPWRAHRLFSACRAFAAALDSEFYAEALFEDQQRLGWTFWLTTEESRRRVATFFLGLAKRVATEPEFGDPVIQGGYDSAIALL